MTGVLMAVAVKVAMAMVVVATVAVATEEEEEEEVVVVAAAFFRSQRRRRAAVNSAALFLLFVPMSEQFGRLSTRHLRIRLSHIPTGTAVHFGAKASHLSCCWIELRLQVPMRLLLATRATTSAPFWLCGVIGI